MIEEAAILTKIDGYEQQKRQVIEAANSQIAALNGAIQALKELLAPQGDQKEEES